MRLGKSRFKKERVKPPVSEGIRRGPRGAAGPLYHSLPGNSSKELLLPLHTHASLRQAEPASWPQGLWAGTLRSPKLPLAPINTILGQALTVPFSPYLGWKSERTTKRAKYHLESENLSFLGLGPRNSVACPLLRWKQGCMCAQNFQFASVHLA